MAVIRAGTIQGPRKRKLLPDFIAPNLLLTVLAVTAVTDMRRPAVVSPKPQVVRRSVQDHVPPNILVLGYPAAIGTETLRTAILQPQNRTSRRQDTHPPPNTLLTLLAPPAVQDPFKPSRSIQVGERRARRSTVDHQPPNLLLIPIGPVVPEEPAETTFRAPILQNINRGVRAFSQQIYVRRETPAEEVVPPGVDFFKPYDWALTRGHRRIRFVNYSLNLSIGEVVTGEETLRAPIIQPQPRRIRPRTAQIYVRPGGVPAEVVPPAGVDYFKPFDWALTRGHRRIRFVNYSLNLAIGAVPAINNADWSIPRRTRRPLPQFDTPNLLFSTLFVTPIDPFKPSRIEQASATRRKRPLPVESEGINNEIRGGGIMPFDPKLRYFDAATRRKQPLQVESYGINALGLVPVFPPVQSIDERQQTRARRPQDANTFLHRHNFALVDADRHFKYDWTITRGKRPNPFEPDFRNYLTLQPAAVPFEAARSTQETPPRRIRFSDRPTFDLNFLVPRYVSIKPIGVQYHDPAPHARQSVARYTFLHPTQIQLIGQDSFFYGPGRGPFNYDWSIKLRYRYPERASLNDFQRGVPIGTVDFNPSSPGLEYDTFLEQLDYRSKPDRLHFSSLKDRIHYRIQDEDT